MQLARPESRRPSAGWVLPVLAAVLTLWLCGPSGAAAHATLERSEPAAGATLPAAPAEIRLWFTEPLEATYTGADLLDADGNPVAGVTATIVPGHDRQLQLTLPGDLPHGIYTVAWRTLSAADGHTLQGYFGFGVGTAAGAATASTESATSPLDAWRALSRGLALIALAAVLAIAPMLLGVLDPVRRERPELATGMESGARRFTGGAALLAVAANLAALGLQAATILPAAPLVAAIAETLSTTRYGSLWLARMALELVVIAALAVALLGNPGKRRAALGVAAVVGLAAPLPFSFLSHAAAQPEGQAVAIAADALHLLLAAVWGGGLLLLALVLVPVLRATDGESRGAALRVAIPRFSAIGLAAWGVLGLTGLYAGWLQVGSLAALRETPYGQSLLVKGALLAPVLALGAYHFLLGSRNASRIASAQFGRSLGLETFLVVAVLLTVGRLIGQEPAREVLASRTPGSLAIPLLFPAGEGERAGELVVSPGATGPNTFKLALPGPPLPAETEAVLRFALPERDIGGQELVLVPDGVNRFRGVGAELALSGDWQVEAVVRKIGAFSWSASRTVPIGAVPPPPSPINPAPIFAPPGVAALVTLTLGIAALAGAAALHQLGRRRGAAGAVGAAVTLLGAARLAPVAPAPAIAAVPAEVTRASTSSLASDSQHHVAMGTPRAVSDMLASVAGPGTPVVTGPIQAQIRGQPERAGPAAIEVALAGADGTPLEGARVVVLSEMTGMAMARAETTAVETAPGQYLARDVPQMMPGRWQIAVRVSPRGEASATARFQVTVP